MLWFGVIFFAFFAWNVHAGFRPNNVCKRLSDYKTIYTNKNCWYNPDVGSSPRLIAKRYGYPFEKHEVTTKDGYILTLHRIPSGSLKSNGSNPYYPETLKPILIQHGLAGVSTFWMLQGKKSLAFFLADRGYDVWLSNFRGTYYSSKHVTLNQNDQKYWDYGLHEIAIYDLPACIDLISNKTGAKGDLIYVGHSMGTTVSYIYSIMEKKHAEENLKAIVSLAPVAYMEHVKGLFGLAPSILPLANILESCGVNGLGQNHELISALMSVTCGKYPLIIPCNLLINAVTGVPKDTHAEMIPVFLSYYPSAVSLNTIRHYSQIVGTNKFSMFDHGVSENAKIYNSSVPDEYDVSSINIPVYLFVGTEDIIGNPQDSEILYNKLKSKGRTAETEKYFVPYAHNEFFLAKDLDIFHDMLLNVLTTKIG